MSFFVGVWVLKKALLVEPCYVVYSEIKYLLLLTAVQLVALVATGHMGISQYDITGPDADVRIACVTVCGVNV